jgi:capsular polysaccharide biosynthesis protein
MTRRREHEQPTPVTQTPESAQADADSDVNASAGAGADEPTVGLGFPDRLVLALLDDAKDVLTAVGVRLSVVSLDEDRALFVSEPANRQVSVQKACELSRRVLTQVAGAMPGIAVELVELRCGRRSEWPCTFSLEWSQEFAASLAALPAAPSVPARSASPVAVEIPSLEMLIGGQRDEASREFGAGMESAAASATQLAPRGALDSSGSQHAGARHGEGPEESPWERLRRRLSPPWLKRRSWLLIFCVLAGTAGGYVARTLQTPMYSARSVIVVATGAGQQGPGNANDAIALALTDASILPSDQALLRAVSQKIGVPPSEVADHLSASVEAGTSVILVSFDASTPAAAVRGADAVGRVITSRNEKISAIPNGSLSLVQLATQATASGLLVTYGLPLGAFLGLLIGLVFAVAIERADPRADDVEDLARATGTAASAYPGPVSLVELEQLLDRASDGAPSVTLVPLSDFETAHAIVLRAGLEAAATHQSLAIELAGPVGSMDDRLTRGEGPTVLVARNGARLRSVKACVQRLGLLGRHPVWAVLAVGTPPADTPR